MSRFVFTEEHDEFLQKYYPDASWEFLTNGLSEFTKSSIISRASKLGIKRARYWTKKEMDILKRNYGNIDWDSMFKLLPNRNKQDIIVKASKLGIKNTNYYWTKEDIQKLEDYYSNKRRSENELVDLFQGKFSIAAIQTKAYKLGISNQRWLEEEIDILIKNYSTMDINELCKLIPNRKKNNIKGRARKFNLLSKNYLDMIYNNNEIEVIKNNYLTMTDTKIGESLGRTQGSVTTKRIELGLFRPKEKSPYEDLGDLFRARNVEWKNASLKKCRHKCIFTGERLGAIHHTHGQNLIIQQAIKEYEIELKEDINDYTDEELEYILDCFYEVQSRYPLGVCLTDKIHKLFHNNYGYGNNTIEQWDEFKVKYMNGEYDLCG